MGSGEWSIKRRNWRMGSGKREREWQTREGMEKKKKSVRRREQHLRSGRGAAPAPRSLPAPADPRYNSFSNSNERGEGAALPPIRADCLLGW